MGAAAVELAGVPAPHRPGLQALRSALVERQGDSAGAAWREMPIRVRVAVVMLAIDVPSGQDPRDVARRPWRSYTDGERAALGAVARTLRDGLADAGRLVA
ncbi:MAG: hypothetical protein RIQ53_3088 [Pseudomonadota bacterium]|jgi:hypothetical protein